MGTTGVIDGRFGVTLNFGGIREGGLSMEGGLNALVAVATGALLAAITPSCFSLMSSLATLAAKMAPGLSSGCESYSCSFQRPSRILPVALRGLDVTFFGGWICWTGREGLVCLADTWGGRRPEIAGTMGAGVRDCVGDSAGGASRALETGRGVGAAILLTMVD